MSKPPTSHTASPHLPCLDHGLGRAPQTLEGDGPTFNLFNYWRTSILMRPGDHSDMPYQEIEEDNLSSLFIQYCHWLGMNSVPRNARFINRELLPPVSQKKDAPVTIIMESTLVKYVRRTIAWLRRIYPRHPDFVGLKVGDTNAVPEWWTHLSLQFKKQCHRREENLSSDYTYGSATVRPLYYHREKNDPSIQDIVSKIDLGYILKSLMMKAQPGLSEDALAT